LAGEPLGQYEAAFRENDIDETVLTNLTVEDLKELGVAPLGHRRKLLDAIAALRADVGVNAPSATAEPARPSTAKPTETPIAKTVGERRHIIVLFCDLFGSTSISAGLDTEEWRDLVVPKEITLERMSIRWMSRNSRQCSRHIGQAASLMFALNYTAKTHIHCGHFAVANSLLDQVIALADQKGAPYWKGFGMSEQACVLLATEYTSAAVHQLKL
jgi:class 3 adenylate cyclase